MAKKRSLAKLAPLTFGRWGRVVVGLATLAVAGVLGLSELGTVGSTALVLLGLSFVVGGVVGNPGCEITALPNLVLPSDKRIHCL